MVESQLSDSTAYLQWGQSSNANFFNTYFGNLLPSAYRHWPTDTKPDGLYKIGSLNIIQGQDMRVISRQTYSVLDFLGDVGGLFGALR